jgi:acetyl-CoA carboxylase biotin carboxyl carrier protein
MPATAGHDNSAEQEERDTQLTEDEVLQILDLVEKSNFDYLDLEIGDLKLTVSKSGVPAMPATVSVAQAAPAVPAVAAAPAAEARAAAAPAPAPAVESAPASQPVTVKEGTVPIKAPMVGTFYATPEPGAPPFVKLGDHVDAETTVGLVEVMKVFNAVSSGADGTIDEICVESGQFVEHGQTLFLVRT